MLRNLLGFFAITTLILLGLSGLWFGLRQHASVRTRPSYQTPLVQKLVEKSKMAPLMWTNDWNSPFVSATAEYLENQWLVKQDVGLKTHPLADFLSQLPPDSALLLFYNIDSPSSLPSLRTLMKNTGNWQRTIFCSRHDKILQDLRQLEPEWAFCSGEIEMTRHLSLNSVGLSGLLDISADVLFIHLKNMSAKQELSPLIAEAKKQKKLVLIGPLSRPLESLEPHGWLVE